MGSEVFKLGLINTDKLIGISVNGRDVIFSSYNNRQYRQISMKTKRNAQGWWRRQLKEKEESMRERVE